MTDHDNHLHSMMTPSSESHAHLSQAQLLEKLQQAEIFVSYQQFLLTKKDEEITSLRENVERLTQEFQAQSVKKEELRNSVNSDEVETSSLQKKLQQAAEYINYQTEQIEELTTENEQLKNQVKQQLETLQTEKLALSKSPQLESVQSSSEELKDAQSKLEQAAEYVKYQEDLITTQSTELEQTKNLLHSKQAEIDRLEQLLKKKDQEALSIISSEELIKLQAQLQQAADFVNYQTEQLNEKQEEASQLRNELSSKDRELQHLFQQKQSLEHSLTELQAKTQKIPLNVVSQLNEMKTQLAQFENWGNSIAESAGALQILLSRLGNDN